MFPEIGHFALIIGFCFSILLSFVLVLTRRLSDVEALGYAQVFARATGFFFLIAFLFLIHSFMVDDFSVRYVAENSNTKLPLPYKIAATWGGHEGSFLLWVLDIALWMVAITFFSKKIEAAFVTRVLSVLGMIITGFSAFMLWTSNPFSRVLTQIPAEGRDLNPMLQDFGLIVHPPMLYMGYVGFSVSFAFAIAALLSGRIDAAWVRWCRPWTLVAWTFLTGGIALGSWWAYYELGWGGWWFWDPVENASFMPWLVGTALLHALIVSEKRALFYNWTILLAIASFALSLLGTFLVRSGVLTSVHSFASDPERGLFILLLLCVVVGGSLFLFGLRAKQMRSAVKFELISKDMLLLVGNILLVVACATVLLGTLYPLLIDALGLGQISVGAPYFNLVFVPLALLSFFLMGIAPLMRWRKNDAPSLKQAIKWNIWIAPLFGCFAPWWIDGQMNIWASLGLGLAAWIFLATCSLVKKVVSTESGLHWHRFTPNLAAMVLAHAGIAITTVGATMVSNYEIEKSVRMGPNTEVEMAGYHFTFLQANWFQGPNYRTQRAEILVEEDQHVVALLKPERRFYEVRTMNMTEAGIDWGLFRDLYVTLGEPINDTDFAVRLNYKPFVRWLWFGALFMMAGGLLSVYAKVNAYRRDKMLASQTKLNSELTYS
tara:strand:+ start:4471 stop:6450 length:1980 start_codon:yes stop_codon:yes gene_type:complete